MSNIKTIDDINQLSIPPQIPIMTDVTDVEESASKTECRHGEIMWNVLILMLQYIVFLFLKYNKSALYTDPVRLFFTILPPLSWQSFHAVMTIMEIIITIRANHWSFEGENYPSVTCPSPGNGP